MPSTPETIDILIDLQFHIMGLMAILFFVGILLLWAYNKHFLTRKFIAIIFLLCLLGEIAFVAFLVHQAKADFFSNMGKCINC